jgi:hypothetical protein
MLRARYISSGEQDACGSTRQWATSASPQTTQTCDCALYSLRRWQSPEVVELVQFMGKDNVPFHTVIFPASLLGSGRPWTMMKNISVTEYLNYEGGKFSKSRGTGECEVRSEKLTSWGC